MSMPPDRLPLRAPARPADVTVPATVSTRPNRVDYVGPLPTADGLGPLPPREGRESGERAIRIPKEGVVEEIVVKDDKNPQDINSAAMPEGDSTAALIQASQVGVGEVIRTFRAVNIDGQTQLSGSCDTIASVARVREMTEADHAAIDEALPFWKVVVGERDVTVTDTQSGKPSLESVQRSWDGLLATFVDGHPSRAIGVEAYAVPVDQETLGEKIWQLGRDARRGSSFPNATPAPDEFAPEFAQPIRDELLKAQSAGQRPQAVVFLVGGATPDKSVQNAHEFAGSVTPTAQYPLSLRVIPGKPASRNEAAESLQLAVADPRTWHSPNALAVMQRVPTIQELRGTPKVIIPEFSPNPPEYGPRDFTITIGHEATSGQPVKVEPRRGHAVITGATEAGKTTAMVEIALQTARERKRRGDAVTSTLVVGLEKPVPAQQLADAYQEARVDAPVIRYSLGATGTDHYPAALALFEPMDGLSLSEYAHGIITTYRMLFTASEQGSSASDGRGLTMLTQALQESILGAPGHPGLLEQKGYNVDLDKPMFASGKPAPFTLRELSDAIAETIARLETTDAFAGGGRWVNDVKAFYRTNIEGPASGPAGRDLVGTGQTFDWKEAMRQGATIAVDVTGVHEDYRALYTAVVFMKAHQALQVLNQERQSGERPYDALGLVDEAQGLIPDNDTGGSFLRMLETSRSFDMPKQKPGEPDAGMSLVLFSQSPILPGRGDQNISWRLVLRTPPGEVQEQITTNLGLTDAQGYYLGHMDPGEGVFWTRRQKGRVNRIRINQSDRSQDAHVYGPEAFLQLGPAYKEKVSAEVADHAERFLNTPWGRIFTGYMVVLNGFIQNGLGFALFNEDLSSEDVTKRVTSAVRRNLDAYITRDVSPELREQVRDHIVRRAADKIDQQTRKAVLSAGLPADELVAVLPDVTRRLIGWDAGSANDLAGFDLNKITDFGLFFPIRIHLENDLQPLNIPVEGRNPLAQRRSIKEMVRREVGRRYREFKGQLEKNLMNGIQERLTGKEWAGYEHVQGNTAREQLKYLTYLEEQAVLNPAIITGEQWSRMAEYLTLIDVSLENTPPATDIGTSNFEAHYRARLPDMNISFSARNRKEQLERVDEIEAAFRARLDYRGVPLIDFFAPGPSGTNLLEEAVAGIIALQVPDGTIYERPTVEDVALKRMVASGSESEWGNAASEFLHLMFMNPYASSQVKELINTLIYNVLLQQRLEKERSPRT